MNPDFKLCKKALDGLKLLNNELPSELSKRLLKNAVKQILIVGLGKLVSLLFKIMIKFSTALPPKPDLYEEKAELSKLADFGICSFLILSAKFDSNEIGIRNEELGNYLAENQVKKETIDQLVEIYEQCKEEIKSRLACLSDPQNIPKLTNCTWELNYNVKSNSSTESDLEYKIDFQSFDQKTGSHQTISNFHCNPEELTFLINKLKDIERHCEKLALNK
jgi:hypothetical protein